MNVTWKLGSMAALAAAGFVASKVTEVGWKMATGRPAPMEDDEEATLVSIVLFAAASAAVAAVAQRYASRTAARVFDPTGEKGIRQIKATPEA